GLAGASRHRPPLPCRRRRRPAGPGPGGHRPPGGQRRIGAAGGAARRGTTGVGAVRRARWVGFALLGGALACAEWAGPGLGGPGLSMARRAIVRSRPRRAVMANALLVLRRVLHSASVRP